MRQLRADAPAAPAAVPTLPRAATWLRVAAILTVSAAAVAPLPVVRAVEDGPSPTGAAPESDAAGRLDRIAEKLDRLLDRMTAERQGPPGPPAPPPLGPGGPRPEPHGDAREHGHHGPHGEPGHHGPQAGPRGWWPGMGGGPPVPGQFPGRIPGQGFGAGVPVPGRSDRPEPWHGPGMGPWSEMPAEMREMVLQPVRAAHHRLDEAGEKFRQLEERIRRLEAEVERLKGG